MARLTDNRYYIKMTAENEKFIQNNSVDSLTEIIKFAGENEGYESIYENKKFIGGEAYGFKGNEYIITEDSRLFYWASVNTRVEIVNK